MTTIERTKAKALTSSPTKKKSLLSKAGQGIMKGFSAGERDLYAEVKQINMRTKAMEKAELERTQAVSMPGDRSSWTVCDELMPYIYRDVAF